MDPSKRIVKEAFVDKVAAAMCIFFDCKCFSVDRLSSVDWTFFGIAENTIVAARGFEDPHEAVLIRDIDRRPGRRDHITGTDDGRVVGEAGRLLVEGLHIRHALWGIGGKLLCVHCRNQDV